jgi:YHS domain-containing protein
MSRTALSILALTLTASALAAAEPPDTAAPAVQRVESKKVCMVTNAVFAKDQIPVVVEGRTYYGCCEMCKERLAKDAAARVAVDPVSGKKVDKAKAVIGVTAEGDVVYFENEKNLAEYNARRPAAGQ